MDKIFTPESRSRRDSTKFSSRDETETRPSPKIGARPRRDRESRCSQSRDRDETETLVLHCKVKYCSRTTQPKVFYSSPITKPKIEHSYLNTKPKFEFCSLTNKPKVLSVGPSVGWSVIDFLIFQKRGFESTNSNMSTMTKFELLDSLLQEVIAWEIQIATCLIQPHLYCLIHFSKMLPWKLSIYL